MRPEGKNFKKTNSPVLKTFEKREKRFRTWFGAGGKVIIGPGFRHNAGLGSLLFPHPPVVNWLIRRGLSMEAQYALSFSHELGHLQSIPAVISYAVALLVAGISKGHASPLIIVFLLVSTQAAWEMMAETLTVVSDYQSYRHYYEGISVIPRIIFWLLAMSLTTMGWLIALT